MCHHAAVSSSFTARVLPWSARYRLGTSLALAGACLLLFFLGVASPSIRASDRLRPMLLALLLGAGLFSILWMVIRITAARVLTVDAGAVRVGGRAPIELGTPRKIRRGRFERTVRRRAQPHQWLAIDGADGRVVVLVKPGKSDWPSKAPPASPDEFDAGMVDLEALRTALDRG